MTQIKICKMELCDVDDACKIESACFSMPFKKKDFLGLISEPAWHFFVAKLDECVVGYISFIAILDETDLVNIAVLPEHRGKGVGKALLDLLIADANSRGTKCIHLEVRKSNACAIGLYEKYGFVEKAYRISINHMGIRYVCFSAVQQEL